MTPTRRQTFVEIDRTGIARWEALKRLVLVAAIGVTLLFMLASCTFARGTGTGYTLAAVGADLTKVRITATEFTSDNVNNSTAFIELSKRIKQMFDAYLVYQGLTFLGGKYYDHAGAEVSSAQAVKLEELRNAKDIKTAELRLEELKLFPPEAAPIP